MKNIITLFNKVIHCQTCQIHCEQVNSFHVQVVEI